MYAKLFQETCGMFNSLHALMLAFFFGFLGLLLYLSRHLNAEQVRKAQLWIAVGITILEIIKITSRISTGYGPDSWVPLYYCSLFIFAIWLTQSKNAYWNRMGYAYITMGGILASTFFMLYPSTSLGMYPFFHPSSVHSFIYHLVMCYTGIVLLWKGVYVPQKRDSLPYMLFVLAACIPAAILNELIGTNCMFLNHPFGLPVLQPILELSKPAYLLIVCAGQAVLIFWVNYGLLNFAKSRVNKDNLKKELRSPV